MEKAEDPFDDDDIDLETIEIQKECWACGAKFSRRVSRASARFQKLCSKCKVQSPDPSPRRIMWP